MALTIPHDILDIQDSTVYGIQEREEHRAARSSPKSDPLTAPEDESLLHEQDTLEEHHAGAQSTSLEALQTVKDVQEAINTSHPFGLKIWKPALYKKSRSVNRTGTESVRKTPGEMHPGSLYLLPGNVVWGLLFGWWIALLYAIVALLLLGPIYGLGLLLERVMSQQSYLVKECLQARCYIRVMLDISLYILWPFGKYITKQKGLRERQEYPGFLSEQHQEEEEANDFIGAEPRSPSLPRERSTRPRVDIGRQTRLNRSATRLQRWRQNLIGKGLLNFVFHILYLFTIAPVHLLVSLVCYFLVLPIPMAKLNYLLVKHMLWHALELSCHQSYFEREITGAECPSPLLGAQRRSGQSGPNTTLFWRQTRYFSTEYSEESPLLSSLEAGEPLPERNTVVLCIYKAMSLKYYKYTLDGINILIINMLALVLFTIINFYYVAPRQGNVGISSHGVLFASALVSTIPLAYFIGMAVSSITAQTGNIALGSVINATFGSIIEIILYCLAIMDGKERVVEGAIIGSMLCGLLALPGVSMFSGGLKRKEQTFNAKAAGVSTTMLVMAVIGVFSPTIFQMIYGSVEMRCKPCLSSADSSCQRCRYFQSHPSQDSVYLHRTRPFIYLCVTALVLTYAIGLWFTLRTHTRTIYAPKKKSKKRKGKARFLPEKNEPQPEQAQREPGQPVPAPPTFHQEASSSISPVNRPLSLPSTLTRRQTTSPLLSDQAQNNNFFNLLGPSIQTLTAEIRSRLELDDLSSLCSDSEAEEDQNGHENPNWSNFKSAAILMSCTILYSLIAEVLIGSVDGFMSSFPVDEKFLGLTLFAIAPTVTEFYNAIAFARSGNIALSLEIGSAYVIQVTLLQIPALVAFSTYWSYFHPTTPAKPSSFLNHLVSYLTLGSLATTEMKQPPLPQMFTLIFPYWDLFSVFLSVFILSYTYIEGKSNYFKGAMLLLAYFVLMSAFLFVPGDLF